MKARITKLLKNWRIITLIVFLLLSAIAIHPDFSPEGVAIRSVADNSSAYLAGIRNPPENSAPMSRERILAIDNKVISDVADYHDYVSTLGAGRTVKIKTNKNTYTLHTKKLTETIILNETEFVRINETYQENISVNGTVMPVNTTKTRLVEVNKSVSIDRGMEDIGLKVFDAPTTNIVKGLDFAGGTRVLLRPEELLSSDVMDILISNMKQRLNIYGLSDLIIRPTKDLSGNQYVVVEIAGANEEEVKELISKQGKFEAKVGDRPVFTGGNKDITYVCRTAQCSGIDPMRGCGPLEGGGYVCSFRFSITLRADAADRMAEATKELDILTTDESGNQVPREERHLSEKLYLYLDNEEVDSLNIGADLKGRSVTDIQISGSGVGVTEQEAARNAIQNMKKLQTILITGSLPAKLEIEKIDNLSPALGSEFLKNALLIGVTSIFAVAIVVYIRFRRLSIALPMVVTMLSEVILLLGAAALIGWNIDLAAIAGIIIAIGTGVDHQIIIADEAVSGAKKEAYRNWRARISKAFFIIMAAYFTTLVAMVPLYSAGAGLLRGFAITTILGISFGVFITRPAFAIMIETFSNE